MLISACLQGRVIESKLEEFVLGLIGGLAGSPSNRDSTLGVYPEQYTRDCTCTVPFAILDYTINAVLTPYRRGKLGTDGAFSA